MWAAPLRRTLKHLPNGNALVAISKGMCVVKPDNTDQLM